MPDEGLQTPWDRASKTKSHRHEQSISKLGGGKPAINSGRSTWTSKRDGVLGRVYKFLVEGRITDSGSYRVERKEFLELRKQAYQSPPGLLPMFRLDIAGLRLVVIEEKDMDEMQTRMLDLEERLANRETESSDGL